MAVSFEQCGGSIHADVYDQACIHSLDDALARCRRIGYPIMLKASWGGGGKGIRKVSQLTGQHGVRQAHTFEPGLCHCSASSDQTSSGLLRLAQDLWEGQDTLDQTPY